MIVKYWSSKCTPNQVLEGAKIYESWRLNQYWNDAKSPRVDQKNIDFSSQIVLAETVFWWEREIRL